LVWLKNGTDHTPIPPFADSVKQFSYGPPPTLRDPNPRPRNCPDRFPFQKRTNRVCPTALCLRAEIYSAIRASVSSAIRTAICGSKFRAFAGPQPNSVVIGSRAPPESSWIASLALCSRRQSARTRRRRHRRSRHRKNLRHRRSRRLLPIPIPSNWLGARIRTPGAYRSPCHASTTKIKWD
jgi:hypothetical protein